MSFQRGQLMKRLAALVVEEFLDRVDPDEKRWEMGSSVEPLRKDLYEAIDGAIGDWEIETEKG